MKLGSFVLYDIKRLFGHGKTAVLAILAPIPVLLMFVLFLAPILLDGKGAFITGAVNIEDDSKMLNNLMNLIIDYEVGKGNADIFPVDNADTGKRMVEDGEASVFLYVPKDTYQNSLDGKRAVMEFYYSPSHAFDALTFQTGIRSSVSVFGQGIRVVGLADELAKEIGLTKEQTDKIRSNVVNDLINIYFHRGRVIGKDGILLFGGDYHFRYAMALLFAACAFFASFTVIYLTCLDKTEIFSKRIIPDTHLLKFYTARIISGAILIMCTFAVMYPLARAMRHVKLRSAFSVLPGMMLTALSFSALAVLIGSLFKRGQSALWAGLYFGIISAAGVTFLSDKADLPEAVSFLMKISPFRASISIFSNAMFNYMAERYSRDMLVLFLSFVLFAVAGFFAYRKRGAAYE